MAEVYRDDDEGEERLRLEREMEERLLREEVLERDEHHHHHDLHDNHDRHFHQGEGDQMAQLPHLEERSKLIRISYTQASFVAAAAVLWYALRTRQQWYLALVFVSSSKWAYIVLGNALIALCIYLFRSFTNMFLGGLRLVESEGLGDFFRWNVTETCLALTMFRAEINVETCILFLFLVLFKCLHWVLELREGHLRMTQEAVVPNQNIGIMRGWPLLHKSHIGIWAFLQILLFLDVAVVAYCAQYSYSHGLSVYLLFGFEAAIMLVTNVSLSLLWLIHVADGLLHYMHEETTLNVTRLLHAWKDQKATITFAVEVQAQGAKFLAYVTFFGVILSSNGLPINLFREVYMSFQSLKSRLLAFAKYRKLMASMNRFESISSEDELEQIGRTCIICRDDMSLGDSKKLPGCGHAFHKSCLREWLVQQQTCPTCRGDISIMEARARQEKQRLAAEEAKRDQDEPLEQQANEAIHPPAGEGPSESSSEELPSYFAMKSRRKEYSLNTPIEMHVFPALYQVSCVVGARVTQDDGSLLRVISLNKGVVVIGLQWRDVKMQDNSAEGRLFLQVPDGWIPENELIPLFRLCESITG